MDREEMFKKVVVSRGNHYCMFCDQDADFVISNDNVSPKREYPMCNECAALFKQRINYGVVLAVRTKQDFITNAEKRRYEHMKRQ